MEKVTNNFVIPEYAKLLKCLRLNLGMQTELTPHGQDYYLIFSIDNDRLYGLEHMYSPTYLHMYIYETCIWEMIKCR